MFFNISKAQHVKTTVVTLGGIPVPTTSDKLLQATQMQPLTMESTVYLNHIHMPLPRRESSEAATFYTGPSPRITLFEIAPKLACTAGLFSTEKIYKTTSIFL